MQKLVPKKFELNVLQQPVGETKMRRGEMERVGEKANTLFVSKRGKARLDILSRNGSHRLQQTRDVSVLFYSYFSLSHSLAWLATQLIACSFLTRANLGGSPFDLRVRSSLFFLSSRSSQRSSDSTCRDVQYGLTCMSLLRRSTRRGFPSPSPPPSPSHAE